MEKIAFILNTSTLNRSLLLLMILFTMSFCQKKKDRNLEYIKQEIINLGYEGNFERPSGPLQKTAMSFMGIDDLLTYSGGENSFAIVKFKDTDEKDIYEKIESLMGFIGGFVDEKDRRELDNAREILHRQSTLHNNVMVLWQEQEPKDVVKLIKRNF